MNDLRRVALATSLGGLLAFAACSSSPSTDTGEIPDEDSGAADASTSDVTSQGDASQGDASQDAASDTSIDAPLVDGGADAHEAGADADAGTVIVKFDTLVNGTLTPGHAGLTWDADWYVYSANPVEYQAHSGTQFITNNTQQNAISFSFPQPVTFDGAWFSLKDSRAATVRFDVYDAVNVKLGSSATLTQVITPTFLPVGIAGVKKVTVVFVDDFAMDDVTYRP